MLIDLRRLERQEGSAERQSPQVMLAQKWSAYVCIPPLPRVLPFVDSCHCYLCNALRPYWHLRRHARTHLREGIRPVVSTCSKARHVLTADQRGTARGISRAFLVRVGPFSRGVSPSWPWLSPVQTVCGRREPLDRFFLPLGLSTSSRSGSFRRRLLISLKHGL